MSTEERLLRLENAINLLVDLARTQSERMDEYERRSEELAEAQRQTEAHLSVLAEVMADLGRAQTRTEVALTRTEAALTSLTERFEQYISSRP
jgi:hypothetical protein